MKKLMVVLFATLCLLTGCNTIDGIGKDVQGGGKAISNSADAVEDSLHSK